ncbi:uncharacterized protein B0I36DRAFT_411611 [Microdochium trichocladiopsis]|uniref:FAD-binding PCMH-type domain-containing protein n=1 Tax=Microdochium trichocladiopsis TaxID=1682393 RepID=A0A9P8Y5U3_9PEZI|nr:uncharacterized protein B0I36DRAFT_411611 [Microdochium trichocladiopsis]KAH7029595.1 hypothetical protein B0I36DRAFT_411611 [Microdochium trichocladiopsis]
MKPTQASKTMSSTAALLLYMLVPCAAHANSGLPPCDALLVTDLAPIVHLPDSPLYPALSPSTRKQSWCYVVPTSAEEVSGIVTTLRDAGSGAGDWHVAIRSGGHGGDLQNNLDQGVTIDLSRLNETVYDAAKGTASVGTGGRWLSVYDTLSEHGVSVTGGREGIVGVGGLVLGGGISWYTQREGFACDNAINFEVVLANGEIVDANKDCNADLWKALKGGSSNFGIVTRFDLAAYDISNISVVNRVVNFTDIDAVVDAVVNFTNLDRSHSDNALIIIVQYDPATQDSTVIIRQVNTMNKADSDAYDAFNAIPPVAGASTTPQSLSLPEFANTSQIAGPPYSAGAGSLTLLNDVRILRFCMEQYKQLVSDLTALLGATNFRTILDLQPLPAYVADIGAEKGGNMLNIGRQPGNKIVFVCGVLPTGTGQGDDNADTLAIKIARAYQLNAAMNARIEDYAASIEAGVDLRYLPYADARQDALGSYGQESVLHMKSVAAKYDPNGFFQKMVNGGFKISRVGPLEL